MGDVMNNMNFDKFQVKPATNDFVVELQKSDSIQPTPMSTLIFTDFDKFVDWVKEHALHVDERPKENKKILNRIEPNLE